MIRSKKTINELITGGSLLILGSVLFLFYIYPPLLLFRKGQSSLIGESLFNSGLLQSLGNSLFISFGVFIITTIVGSMLAWIVVRTDFPMRKLVDNLTMVAFTIPPYILALAWLQLMGRNGYLERIQKILFPDVSLHLPAYSLTAAVIVMSLHLYPLVYMVVRNTLEQLDLDMENAAFLSGASGHRVTLGITLPMILPNLISTGLLVFSRTMANFSVPSLLCLPAGIDLVPTSIYSSLSNLQVDKAAALSLLLVLISTLLYIIQGISLNTAHMGTARGRDKDGKAQQLRKSRPFLLISVVVFFGITVFLPIAAMFISSFLKRWGLPLETQFFTLNNYREIFRPGGKAAAAFRNSLVYGMTAALLASIIGTGAAISGSQIKSKAGRLIETAASWPMAIPNTVLAVAAIFAWNKAPLKLYGTPWGLIVTYMVLFTPIIMKQVSGLLKIQDIRLLKAARTAGANGIKTFFTITLSLLKPGFISGILLCLMISLREIPISLLLYSAGQETVGVLLFGMQSQEYGLEMTSALAIVIMAIVIGLNTFINLKKDKKNEQTRN